MSEVKPALFIAISGIRGSGRTRVYEELESLLPARFGGDQTFAFFKDPFGRLPHPLLWEPAVAAPDPATSLFDCWKVLNEFTVKQLRPALAAHDVVVVDGYGLNALLYATACISCNRMDADASHMHHKIVEGRVLAQGIHPPLYFVTQADPGLMTRYLKGLKSGLTEEQCHAFLNKETRIITEYFNGTGQKGTLLSHELSIGDMAKIVSNEIEMHIEERRKLAA